MDQPPLLEGVRSQSSQTQFSCSECTYAFTSLVFLHKHIKRSHNKLYCQMLRNGQIPSAGIEQITISVTSQKPGDTTERQKHICKHCDKSFTHLGTLNRHQYVHTGEKPFHCAQCAKRFSLLSNLKTHQRLHTGEKPFSCTQCAKSFSQLTHLRTHQRLHTGEKPFHCRQCDQSFNELGSLKRHQRVHNDGEKPFKCQQCGKSFNDMGNMKRHQRIHSGEKPFHCKESDKSFSVVHTQQLCPPESADENIKTLSETLPDSPNEIK